MTSVAIALALVLLGGPTLRASSQPETTDVVGFDSFSKLLTWLGGLPQAFQNFVSSEKRGQLARTLKTVADAFGNINDDCLSLARLVDDTTPDDELRKPFQTLVTHIVELRSAVRSLAADLGEEAGKEGSSLAFELAKLTQNRADITEEARKQVLGGERADAVKKLRRASELAEEAQKLVIGFIPTLTGNP